VALERGTCPSALTDDQPANKVKVSFTTRYTWRWGEYVTSSSVQLVKGQRYFIEALHKEGTGGDQVRAGWRTPSMAADATPVVIPGSVLSPFINPLQPPDSVQAVASPNGRIDLTWQDVNNNETGYVLERSADDGTPFAKIATLAANTITSVNALPGSSRVACAAVSSGFMRPITHHVHATYTAAATVHPAAAAALHPAVIPTAAATATPTAPAAVTGTRVGRADRADPRPFMAATQPASRTAPEAEPMFA